MVWVVDRWFHPAPVGSLWFGAGALDQDAMALVRLLAFLRAPAGPWGLAQFIGSFLVQCRSSERLLRTRWSETGEVLADLGEPVTLKAHSSRGWTQALFGGSMCVE